MGTIQSLLRQRFKGHGSEDPVETDATAEEKPTATLTLLPLPPRVGTMADRAVEAVEGLSDELEDWFKVDVNALIVAWERVKAHPNDQDVADLLFRAAHNLAGAETLYGKPEVSRLCRSLVKLIKRGKVRTDKALLELHIDACRAVSMGKTASSGSSQVCEALEAEVSKLVAA